MIKHSDYTLLVVDNELDVLNSFSEFLKASEFQVYTASDSGAALSLFDEHSPDLVITDLHMSGESTNFMTLIHARAPEIPVIVVSSVGVMSDVVQALRSGAVDYLIKPVLDMEMLLHAVTRGLERSHLLVENRRYRRQMETMNQKLRSHIASLEQDQQAGHFVQQQLSPPNPFYASRYICSHTIIPSLFLSGDCIDYGLLEKRYFSFYLADISGHGSAPAFVAIWLRNFVLQMVRLRQLLSNFNSMNEALNQVLSTINREILNTGLQNHLTMIVGIIDTETNELFYCVAGHLPLIVLLSKDPESGKKASYLPGKGKALGLYKDAEWQVFQHSLDAKDSLVLFSDGILEIMPGKDLIDKEEALLEKLSNVSQDFDSITDRLSIQAQDERPDDIALLTICRK